MHQEVQKKSTHTPSASPLALLGLVGELGLIISLPLLVMVFLGIKLDRMLHMFPLFLIIGMIVAAVTSALLVAHKIKKASAQAGL